MHGEILSLQVIRINLGHRCKKIPDFSHFCAPSSLKNWVGTTQKWEGTQKKFFGASAEPHPPFNFVPLHFPNPSGAYAMHTLGIKLKSNLANPSNFYTDYATRNICD